MADQTRLSGFSTAPKTLRSYYAQQGQQMLDSLKPQQPAAPQADPKPLIPDLSPLLQAQQAQQSPQDSPSAQLSILQQLQPSQAMGPLPQNAEAAVHDIGDQAFNHWCQKFVEQATLGHSGVYPSAIAAWHAQQDKAKTGLNGINPGDLVYFAPDQSNGGAGHTGIYTGNGRFVSATDNGVQENGLADWMKATGQRYLGYIPSSKVGDPKSRGNPGAGGGNPFGALFDSLKRTGQNFVKGYTESPQQAPSIVDNPNMEAYANALANSPAGAGADLIGQGATALMHGLQALPAAGHVLAGAPMALGALRTAAKTSTDAEAARQFGVNLRNAVPDWASNDMLSWAKRFVPDPMNPNTLIDTGSSIRPAPPPLPLVPATTNVRRLLPVTKAALKAAKK